MPSKSMRRLVKSLGLLLVVALLVTAALAWTSMPGNEAPLATEANDFQEIKSAILVIQGAIAAARSKALARGTHAKGVCALANFEVFDVRATERDPALAARLARGLFVHPGTYAATVRFANGDFRVNPDSTPDVRALSFSALVPGASADAPRVPRDFAMNNATTFAFNDAHVFAVFARLVKVSLAEGAFATTRALGSLLLKDIGGVARVVALGGFETHGEVRAYQQTRYFSTVPYAHGATDVIKYAATPCTGNPAQALRDGPDFLADELVRHVSQDPQMSCFDFGLQLLDTEAMTYWGRHRSAGFWVENASVEWKEAEAPFHSVGRLTLVPKSVLPPATCEAAHIDVTENSPADFKPVGSINRARRYVEEASRAARLH